MWVSIITLVLKIVSSVSAYLVTKKYIDSGEAAAISEGLQLTLDNLEKANAARKELTSNPDGDYAKRLREKYQDDNN